MDLIPTFVSKDQETLRTSNQTVCVPADLRSLSVLREDMGWFLADGGLRPGTALRMPEGMLLNCGLCNPELGCLDPNISTAGTQDHVVCGYCVHIHLPYKYN